jgi:hypothetical protein
MKLQPSYRSPFVGRDAFEPVSRREAAQLICQWRRYGNGSVRRMARRDGTARGYVFNDWFSSTDAALVLKLSEYV